ncbi:alternative oxidase [Variovorax sp. J2P1-59]|nr:alternative oxidase [Variovorax sp. J2P1-59]MDM0078869.1 alternative oxidase [Variovorax sp. J2P1-59]
MLIHLKCLRWLIDDEGWIQKALAAAENERMQLTTFQEIDVGCAR